MKKQLWQHPIVVLFFAFLLLFSAVDILKPDKEYSELENRRLTQAPSFSWSEFISNNWTKNYTEYTRDQFLLRDSWVSLQSLLEVGQGKLESGGVWLAQGGYQIAKNSVWTQSQARLFPSNVQAVCGLAQRHTGQVNVMVVPSPANIMGDYLRYNPPQVDENAMTDEMYAQMQAAGANVIDLRGAFAQELQQGTQLYYRTDHHWTTDGGALLAYRQFCAATGQTVLPPPEALRVEVPDFFGTNYSKTKLFGTPPETLVYYNLPNQMTYYKIQPDGTLAETLTGIMDTEKLSVYDKYAAFLHGNNGYSVIQGNGEGSILVVKDSYANSFVPYLVANYETIGVIDLRDWFEVDATFAAGAYDEILVLYSFASFSEDAYLSRMMNEG